MQPNEISFPPPKILAVPDQDGIFLLRINDVLYCKAEGNYTKIFMSEGRFLLTCWQMKKLESHLSQQFFFIRVHHSYMVNLLYVERYLKGDGGCLLLLDKTEVPVARNHRAGLMERLEKL